MAYREQRIRIQIGIKSRERVVIVALQHKEIYWNTPYKCMYNISEVIAIQELNLPPIYRSRDKNKNFTYNW